ncbi:hypothetical protein F8M41_016698 [Gigaspora margarita]|uniref:Uncharacterized protein n=1 Tax=Gigaspora margarita TaxID=4874 RepID=A0A8H3WWU9_GIGMA|nr:hypothetical protein F8M41_016698 [Gigaspora margarita]
MNRNGRIPTPNFNGYLDKDPEEFIDSFRSYLVAVGIDVTAGHANRVRAHGLFETCLKGDAKDWSVSELLTELEEIERYKTEQLFGAYLYSTPKPILEQQFYSNEDIDRLIEERIASKENLTLKKPKEISGYSPSQNPSCSTQVDPNTEAIRQLLEVMKYAKKTLAKKSGSGREKADKIHIDHFLNEVLKNMGDDPNPNGFYDDVDPVEDMCRQLEDLQINLTKMAKAIKKNFSKPKSSRRKTKSKSRTKKKKLSKHVNAYIISDESSSDSSNSENSTISSENELETNTLACSWNELESDLSGTSESSNSESDSEEYEVNATKKKITFLIPKDQRNAKVPGQKLLAKNLVTPLLIKRAPKEVSINGYNMINAKFIALKDPVLNHFTSNFSDKECEKSNSNNFPANKYTTPITSERSQSEAEISWPNPIEINFIRKIIPNDVATICCKISSPLGKIVQVPSAIIDSRTNCLVISKGLIKLLGAEVDKNKKLSVKWRNNFLESSDISYNISVTVGQGENSCTISEDFLVMDDDKS